LPSPIFSFHTGEIVWEEEEREEKKVALSVVLKNNRRAFVYSDRYAIISI